MSLPIPVPTAALAIFNDLPVVVAVVLFAAIFFLYSHRAQARARPLPGPKHKPFVGNILSLDTSQPWTLFTNWRDKYGDLISLSAPGTKILVLNSYKTINDLLDKRGGIYSHRPIFTVVGELMGLDQSMGLMSYGAEWRACRKLESIALSPSAVKQYIPMQEQMATLMVNELLEKPHDFYSIVRLAAGRIVLSVTYGLPVLSPNSKYITDAEVTMNLISRSMAPGAYLCDFIPFLKHLPSWIPFQRRAAIGREMIYNLVTVPYEKVKDDMATGVARPSLARHILSELTEEEKTPEMERRIKWTTGTMYGAGGESTFGTVTIFLLAMTFSPDIQVRAQREIDNVVGASRLPVIADRPRLPYVEAVIKEVFRWRPILPLSIARRAGSDDVYEGYNIPKDTIVLPNSWGVAFEPNIKYPPEEFHPERFLDSESPARDPATWAFGYGRRMCPGKHLAENSTFILICTLLAVFTVTPPAGEDPSMPEFEGTLTRLPKPFECSLEPRSKERVQAVVSAVQSAEDAVDF